MAKSFRRGRSSRRPRMRGGKRRGKRSSYRRGKRSNSYTVSRGGIRL